MRDLVFSVVVVLGALAVMQVSVDAAWAAKKPSHEKHEKNEKKEKKEKKKEKKEDKDKKDEKDKRETNNCPGWLSKGCSPGACRCPVGPDEKDKKKAEEEAKKTQKAKGKEKKTQKAESGRGTQTRKGAEPARRMRSSSSPLSSFVIRYDKGADVLDRRPQIERMLCDLIPIRRELDSPGDSRISSAVIPSEGRRAGATVVGDCGGARWSLARRGGKDRRDGSADAAGPGDPVQ
jgi:flagellum-specific peptidoglycan hydrolase FlgJ